MQREMTKRRERERQTETERERDRESGREGEETNRGRAEIRLQ